MRILIVRFAVCCIGLREILSMCVIGRWLANQLDGFACDKPDLFMPMCVTLPPLAVAEVGGRSLATISGGKQFKGISRMWVLSSRR